MAESGRCTTVCVTGGSGYVASSLIKKLLLNGHTVHATLRNLDDKSKVGILKSLPNATTNLVLFKADIYEPHQFEDAIRGCHIVFHIATPLHHTQVHSPAASTIVTFSQFTNKSEAFNALRFLEELDGKVPLVHIDDVCDAHILCMEQSSINGRFLCATSFLSSSDIANYYRLHHPHLQQKHGECDGVGKRNIKMKLIERGLMYKYDS